jgi:hypothetical protein
MEVVAYLVFMLALMPCLLYLCGYLVNKYAKKLPHRIYYPPEQKLHQSPLATVTDNP